MSPPDGTLTAPGDQAIRNVLRHAPMPMLLVRYHDGMIVRLNQRCAEMFGVTADQAIGHKARDYFVDPRQFDAIPDLIDDDGRFADMELQLRIASGHEIWALAAGQMVRHGGESCLLIGLTDITGRKKTEQALARERALYAAVQENMDQGVLVVGADGAIVTHNRRFTEFYDVPVHALARGTTYADLIRYMAGRGEFGDLSGDEAIESFGGPALRGEAQRFEAERPGGRILEVRSNPLPVGGFVRTYTDITARKQAEAELVRQIAIVDSTLENVDQGISMVDADLNAVAFNERFLELLDLPPGMFEPGDPYEKFIRFNAERREYGPGDVEEQVRTRVELARKFEPHRFERTRPDGVTIEIRGNPVATGGFVTTYTDITARKQAEAAMLSVFESAPIPMVLTRGRRGEVVKMNERAAEMLGTTPEAAVGASSVDVFVDPRRAVQLSEILREQAHVHDFEAVIKLASGAKRQILISGQVLEYEGKTSVLAGYTDITERKEAEDKVRASEARLLSILETSPIGVGISIDGKTAFLNERQREILGWEEETSIGHSTKTIYADPGRRDELLQVVRDKGFIRDAEVLLRQPGGREVWTLATLHPIEYEGKNGIISWNYDITERKRIEATMTSVFESAPIPMVLSRGPRGEVIRINQRAADLQGLTVEEAIGHSAMDYFADPEEGARLLQIARETGRVDDFEYAIRTAAGERQALAAGQVIDYEGRPALLVGYYDITERTEAQKALADQLKFTEALLDTMPNPMFVKDAERNYVRFNRAYVEMFGVDRDKVIGKTEMALTHLPLEVRATYHEEDGELLRTGGSAHTETTRTVDGEEREMIYRRAVFELGDGVVGGIVGILVDISKHKQAERDLRVATQAAEAANQAKSEFLSSMSHELRTPMNAILGFSELMVTNDDEPLSEEQAESVREIRKGGRHLLALINDVLDLAKVETGKLNLSIEDVGLAGILDECVTFTEVLAEKRGIALVDRTAGRALPAVRADHTRSKQVLLNLLSNAVKYNRENGEVILECGDTGDGFARISVTDTGHGIAAEKQSQLFQPFSRLGAEFTDVEGTGFGLSISKNLVELMGGRIGADSIEGQGSTFWIELPLAAGAATAAGQHAVDAGAAPAPTADAAGQGNLILYIEDNPANLRLMERIVGRAPGLDLLTAPSAELGIELAEAHQPAIILMDINLPGIDGFAALERMRRSQKTNHIPVVALSANAMESDIKKGRAAGFRNYLTKPIQVDEVLAAIDEALGLR